MDYSTFTVDASIDEYLSVEPVESHGLQTEVNDNFDIEQTDTLLNHTQTLIDRLVAKRLPLLNLEQEKELTAAAQQGDQKARTELVKHNVRLVFYIARRYTWIKGMDIADIISEGNLGLLHAIDKYDGKLGYRFSTYAGWWIKQYIERSIMNKARLIRVPVYMLQERRRYTRALSELQKKLKREPNQQEVAAFVGKDIDWVMEMAKAELEQTLSLDYATGEDRFTIDALTDHEQNEPETQATGQSLVKFVNILLQDLPEEQSEILILRFGLMGHEPHTLEETAQLLNSTTAEVKRKQALAMRTLRNGLKVDGEYNCI